jgi:hypothetical protein
MQKNFELQQQMFEMIQQWQQSGLSQKAFCEQRALAPYKFYYWYKRYRRQDAAINKSSRSFIKLKIQNHSLASTAEIYFPNGVRVVFNEPVSSDYLKKIIG